MVVGFEYQTHFGVLTPAPPSSTNPRQVCQTSLSPTSLLLLVYMAVLEKYFV